MAYLNHALTTNSILVWGKIWLEKFVWKRIKFATFWKQRNFPNFYRTISSPQMMSCQELSEGTLTEVEMYRWGSGLLSITSTFASLVQKGPSQSCCLQAEKGYTQRSFQVSEGEMYRAPSNHFWPFSGALTGGMHCMVLCCPGSTGCQKPVTLWKIINFHDF